MSRVTPLPWTTPSRRTRSSSTLQRAGGAIAARRPCAGHQQVQGPDSALGLAVRYASECEQVGRQLARFQVVQRSISMAADEVASAPAAVDPAVRVVAEQGSSTTARLAVAVAQVVKLAAASGQNGLQGLITGSTSPSPATGQPVDGLLDLRTGSRRGLRPGLKVEHRVQPAGLRYPDRVLDVQRQI